MKSIDQFLEDCFTMLSPKQRRVVVGRFGLKGGTKITLQEIGTELGVTRERVRQIEAQTMKKLAPLVRDQAKTFVTGAVKHLESVGGVRRDDNFIEDLRAALLKNDRGAKNLAEKVRFVLLAAGEPRYVPATDEMHAYWASAPAAEKKFLDFTKKITDFFKKAGTKKIIDDKAHLALCKDMVTCHYLSIPKHIGTNVFGDVGLREWPEIEPKTVRDKAYLVLKKHQEPLHFEDIAKHIAKFRLAAKPAHVQTVHNELIKDPRFVLVGRGIYGLGEHGYERGTVREVIVKLLKRNGPMDAKRVLTLVNEQRFLKQNTVLLALQNRKHFMRLDDGRYRVKEA
ncbi:MAG: sigma factor-like helix-turn-helix DNA-binding protein [Candidatus Jorgensenbacteria bacterium]|nr:sigma factor-like helix-turn-helix DNA-binding protein [Candidatus Jorgensenbacteria bacterium]